MINEKIEEYEIKEYMYLLENKYKIQIQNICNIVKDIHDTQKVPYNCTLSSVLYELTGNHIKECLYLFTDEISNPGDKNENN